MNLRNLLVVVLRLVALNFLLSALVLCTPLVMRSFAGYRPALTSGGPVLIVLPWLLMMGFAGVAVLIWVFARQIAEWVTRDVSQDISFGALSLVDCYSVALMGVGLFYIANNFPNVLVWMHYLFQTAASPDVEISRGGIRWYDFWLVFIQLVLGIVMFVNGRKWAVALARGQTGNPPAETEVEEKKEPEA